MDLKRRAWLETAAIAILLALFLWWAYPGSEKPPVETVAETPKPIVMFKAPNTEAKSVIVYDALTGESIYEKNADETLPLASLTKLMTALTAAELVPDYMLVRITADDIRKEGDTGLYTDEEWNIQNLIDYSLLVSSNDGVSAIASVAGSQLVSPAQASTTPETLFVARMNENARDLGLYGMRFYNVSGLDQSDTEAGGYGSARDMAKLVSHMVDNDKHVLEATALDKTYIQSKTALHTAGNTNVVIGQIPNVLASKTGYTDLSGGNLVVAWNAGLDRPIVITVLGSSYDGRFSDMAALVDATVEYLSEKAQ